MFLRQFPPYHHTYDGRLTKTAIREWTRELFYKKVFDLDNNGMERIYGNERMAVIMFRDEMDKNADYMEVYNSAAENYKQKKLLWAYTNNERNEIKEMTVLLFGIRDEDLPQIRIIDAKTMKKYKPSFQIDGNLTEEMIADFYKQVVHGEQKPYKKSLPIPSPETNVGPIKVIVVNNFKEVVHSTEWDSVVFVHGADSSGADKEFLTTLEELGRHYD